MQFSAIAIMLASCSTTYQMINEGESLDALTKITEVDKICLYPNGGDNEKNFVFNVHENDVANIYLKDNVLTKAMIQKTSGT